MSPLAPHSVDRAVAILDRGELTASGYLVAPGVVLSCQHMLNSPGDLSALRRDGSSMRIHAARTLEWPSSDMALLFAEGLVDVEPVTIGMIDPLYPDPLPFQMYGWPLWGSELDPSGARLEGGRMVRGWLEPGDESPDRNLVLQPDRTGASHLLGRSDWTGMSGAAVFCLDRLIGVQRRQVDIQRPDSIEARPMQGLLATESAAVGVLTNLGITVDRDWTRSGSRARNRRLEVHGPREVPLFSVTEFELRSDGWDQFVWRIASLATDGGPHRVSSPQPVETLPCVPRDPNQLNRPTRLLVEASRAAGNETATLAHEFRVVPPESLDVAALYEVTMWLLDLARWEVSPSERLRAGALASYGAELLSSAVERAEPDQLVELAAQGLRGLKECLGLTVDANYRLQEDRADRPSEDVRDKIKDADYRAHVPRESLKKIALGGFDSDDTFWSKRLRVLGFGDYAALSAHLRPPLDALSTGEDTFEGSVLRLLLQSGEVDVASPDFTSAPGTVQGRLSDLVNAAIREGVARWRDDTGLFLVPTEVGRLRIERMLDDDR